MARECKRKRDGRRFGRPERLADLLQDIPWLVSRHDPPSLPHQFASIVRHGTAIDAQDVADYVADQRDKEWLWTELPACRLPFPVVFVETMSREPWSLAFPRTGVALWEVDVAGAVQTAETAAGLTGPDDCKSRILDDLAMLRQRARFSLDFGMVGLLRRGAGSRDDLRVVHLNRGTLFLDGAGVPLRAPFGQIDPDVFPVRSFKHVNQFFWHAMFPVVLSLGFMNCRNVTLAAHEPDRALNRERKKAGLRPFVRFHTINIDPMKKVLRAEGGADTDGLKKALHIVRGHFSHYTEDRPLFGRPGLHGAFWMPSHVRGSLDGGAVVSDYRVGAPRP